MVWSGMRGAITLAAAQTLPVDTPYRSLLIVIAFTVAAGSLVIQGGSLTAFVRWIKSASPNESVHIEERLRLLGMLADVARHHDDQTPSKSQALTVIDAQREALLDA